MEMLMKVVTTMHLVYYSSTPGLIMQYDIATAPVNQ